MPKLEDLELKVKQVTANTQGLKGLTSALKGLADSARQLNNSHSDISKLANAFKEFDPKTAAAIKSFSTAIKGLKDTALASSTISIAIGQIAKAFQELTEGVDVEKLERIAYAMNNIKSVSGSAKLLAAAKGAVKTAMEANAPGTKSFGDTMETVSDTTKDTGAAQIEATGEAAAVSSEKLERMWQILEQMGTSVKEDSQLLEEMNRVLNEATPEEVAAAYERMYDALASGNASEISAALSNLQGILSNMAYEAESAAVETEKLGFSLEGLKKVGSTLWKVTAGFANLVKTIASPIWDRFKGKLNGIVGGIRNLVSSFGRIAMYRALRTAIKAITTGFSEGIKHVYQWSQLVGDSFVKSMDSMATSAHYLRDSLGAMASPLIDALAPAIEVLVEHFVTLLNVVNQFIAALTGKDTWRKAVRTPTTYSGAMKEAADNTKKATKAQKELNKALQGFDELNLLTTSEINARKPTTPSSSTTPGVSSTEFETKPIADWIQAIKKAIDDGDWTGAGTLLAEKLNGLVEDWKAKEFGNKLGEKFQKGLDFYLAFMKKFEWEDLGTKIGQMFNGIFETMSAEDLGHALVAHIKAAVKLAKGFLKEAEPTFQALGVAVSTAINDLFDKDFADELGETLGTAVKDAITFLKTMIVGSEKILQNYDTGETITVKVGGIDFKQVGESLMTAIFTAIKTINWADLGETVAGLFTGIIDAIGAGISYAAEHISEIAGAIKDFAVAFFSRMWEWFWPTVFQFLTGGEGYTYQGGDGNDRPNAPTSTGAGATTLPEFNTEMKGMTDGLTEAWKYLEEHNPLNLEVTDTKGTVKAQEKSVEGLNLDLDHTDGTFTSKFATKNLADREKAVKPYWTKVTSLDDTLTSNFKTKNLDDRKKAVTPYWDKVTGLAKTITTKFATSNLESTKKDVASLQKALDDLAKQKNIKVKMTVDVANAGTSQQHLQVNNYFGTRLIAEAEGGFPPQGSMFVAGEVPGQAEMVGTINGKTGVASGKEITGIADAVRDTGQMEAELLREQNNLLRRLLTKTGTVTLAPSAAAGRWVNQSQAAYARATGG